MTASKQPDSGDFDRVKYWNDEYVAYWKGRVAEANKGAGEPSQVVAGDAATTADSIYLQSIGMLEIGSTQQVLELGCGFGRSLSALSRLAGHVSAVDISAAMISVAKEACRADNVTFYVSPSEGLPFADETIDAVVCFAAFDAMYQSLALIEMSRVSRKGARVLITGKNDDYHDDDAAALAAEEGARAKKHPNYFTDVGTLLANLERFGFHVLVQRYYARRGDFAKGIASEARPEKFYEYLFVLRKVAGCTASGDLSICRDVSRTAARR